MPEEKLFEISVPEEYENRLLAYIDVLGWTSLVERSKSEAEAMTILREGVNLVAFSTLGAKMQREFFSNKDVGPSVQLLPNVTHFSDLFVLSARIDSGDPIGAMQLVTQVQLMCTSFLQKGLYTRGAIVVGQVIHTEHYLFGPALVEAYGLERGVAKYPRIVVTRDALPYVNRPVADESELTSFYNVHLDADGLHYLDILGMAAGRRNQRRIAKASNKNCLKRQRDEPIARGTWESTPKTCG